MASEPIHVIDPRASVYLRLWLLALAGLVVPSAIAYFWPDLSWVGKAERAHELSLTEKVELAKLHFSKSIEFKGEPRGVYEMRRHFSNYFKGLPNFKEIRIKLLTTIDPKEVFSILDSINEKYKNIEIIED